MKFQFTIDEDLPSLEPLIESFKRIQRDLKREFFSQVISKIPNHSEAARRIGIDRPNLLRIIREIKKGNKE